MWSPRECSALSPSSSAHHHSPCSVPSSPSPPSAQLRRRQASERRRICLFNTMQTPVRAPPPPRVEQQQDISLEHEQETQPQQSPITIIPTRSRRVEGRAQAHAVLPPPSSLHPSHQQQLARASRPGADACVSEACSSPPRAAPRTSLVRRHLVTRRAVLQELPQDAHEPCHGDTTHTAAAHEHASSPIPSTPLPPPASNFQQQIRTHGFLEAWICVRQQQPGGPAEVYEHSGPLDSATWARLQSTQRQPPKLMTVHDRSFHSCTEARGEWANFHVRLSRGFSPLEETTMFPNIVQLLGHPTPSCDWHGPGSSSSSSMDSSSMHNPILTHALSSHFPPPLSQAAAPATLAVHSITPRQGQASGDPHSRSVSAAAAAGGVVQRRCANARSLGDLVQLLADPTETGVLAHLANTGRLLRDKPRRICRTWGCLKARWGEDALRSLGFTPRKVHHLLKKGALEGLVWHDELRAAHHYRGAADVTAAALGAEGGSTSSKVSAATAASHASAASGSSSSSGGSGGGGGGSGSSSRRDSSEAHGHHHQSQKNGSAQAAAAAAAEARLFEQLRAANARASSQLHSAVPDLCLAS